MPDLGGAAQMGQGIEALAATVRRDRDGFDVAGAQHPVAVPQLPPDHRPAPMQGPAPSLRGVGGGWSSLRG